MAVRPIDGNKLIEWFSPYLHTGEPIPADVVIEDIRSMPTITPPNETLTLEELLRMDGAPVWLDVAGGMWALVDALDGCLWLDRGGSIDIAKFAGKAYRRPPEGEEAGNG